MLIQGQTMELCKPQAKKPLEIAEAGRGQEGFSPLGFGRSTALLTFDFVILDPQTVRK